MSEFFEAIWHGDGIGDGGDLDDTMRLWHQTGHLHVDPYQVVVTDRHLCAPITLYR